MVEQYYDSGQLKSRVEMGTTDGGVRVKHGIARYWDPSGVLVRQCNYVNGRRQGTEIRWLVDPPGAISEIVQYYEGVENGPYVGFDGGGSITRFGMLHDGKEDGTWTYWYPTIPPRAGGGLAARFSVVAGRKNGPWIAWHWNGAKKEEGAYRDDKPVGIWRYWSEDGALERVESWENGNLVSTDEPQAEAPDK